MINKYQELGCNNDVKFYVFMVWSGTVLTWAKNSLITNFKLCIYTCRTYEFRMYDI